VIDALPLALATAADAAEYARFMASNFRATYQHGYDAERLELHIHANYGEAQQRAELSDPERFTLRAARDDRWLGFVMVHRTAEPPAAVVAERPAELERFYVSSDAQGSGLAQRLLADACARVRAAGHDALWLTVWRHNHRAKRFYEKVGFRHMGVHPFVFAGVPELDDLYQLSLTAG
jgi:ribosomal protein S18 acetylase RimI-like enzyme